MSNRDRLLQEAYDTVRVSLGRSQENKKQVNNPLRTAPTLNLVITHMQDYRGIQQNREQAYRVLGDTGGYFLDTLRSNQELSEFLSALSLFLKSRDDKRLKRNAIKEPVQMRNYKPVNSKKEKHLSPEAAAALAWAIVEDHPWQHEWVLNKLIRLNGRLRSVYSKLECFTIMAQYYPLSGVPTALLNRLVNELNTLSLVSFQSLVGLLLVFYKAQAAGTIKEEEKESTVDEVVTEAKRS